MEKFENLSFKEMTEVNGGLSFIATIAAGIIIYAASEIINDWDNFKAGLKGEPEIK